MKLQGQVNFSAPRLRLALLIVAKWHGTSYNFVLLAWDFKESGSNENLTGNAPRDLGSRGC